MFSAARYLVLDDELSELEPLIKALHAAGAPCIGIHYDPLNRPAPELFAGVRILFSDLRMAGPTANEIQDFDNIALILEESLSEDHGPYLLILWTSHENLRAGLSERLEALLAQGLLNRNKLPIAVLALDKNKYRDQAGGFSEALQLQEDLKARVQEIPQINALLSWEREVLRSANATLGVLNSLVEPEDRTFERYPGRIGSLLGQLAIAGMGRANAANDPRGGVNTMLAPILVDQLLNQSPEPGNEDLWKQAVALPPAGDITDEKRGKMNRMLHLALPGAEVIGKTDWGAALPLMGALAEDEAMTALLGTTRSHLLDKEFRIAEADRAATRLFLVRGGANCDQAQANAGPIPFILAALTPKKKKWSSLSPAVLVCDREMVEVDANSGVEQLLVHARFAVSIVASQLGAFPEPLFRLREALLMKILVHCASHVMRPGTLSL
jgi:hypothetical protein